MSFLSTTFRLTIVTFIAFLTIQPLSADIVAEGLLVFPAQVQSLEYANIAQLRTSPLYAQLRRQTAGTTLDSVKSMLAKLGMQEERIQEVVLGTSPNGIYGLISGDFTSTQILKEALRQGIKTRVEGGEKAACLSDEMCFVFLEEATLAFGTIDQVRAMLEARQGTIGRLASNSELVHLIEGVNRSSSIIGVASGKMLTELLGGPLHTSIGPGLDKLRSVTGVSAFVYTISLGEASRITASLICETERSAALLRQLLGGLAEIQLRIQPSLSNKDRVSPQSLSVSGTGRMVTLNIAVGGWSSLNFHDSAMYSRRV